MSYGLPDTVGSLLLIALWATVYLVHLPFFAPSTLSSSVQQNSPSFNGSWYPPSNSQINDLGAVINGTDVFGFIFSDASISPSNASDALQNWCNMPHVNSDTYLVPETDYTLEYVEVVRSQTHDLATAVIRLLRVSRFTDTTNAHPMLLMPFPKNLTLGIAMMKACSPMANP